jgi:hypothetical protein
MTREDFAPIARALAEMDAACGQLAGMPGDDPIAAEGIEMLRRFAELARRHAELIGELQKVQDGMLELNARARRLGLANSLPATETVN